MTTENVTVLFTDLVGSTALASSMTPEAADALRREHFSILRQAIAEVGGAEVKNLGDGLMVVFAAASAALSCAVAMQQGVERDNREREQAVGLRIGLSIGEVSREDDDYFGDPVVEAARLCATCDSGQILATDMVQRIAGRRSRHDCHSLGELTLKGLPDPVETVEVRWDPIVETGGSIPLPGRLAVRPAVGVVGRDADLATIAEVFKRVANGEGREVLLISGEAGLGKTTLVAEAARVAFKAGACVLFGHCEEDLTIPYQLFGEALGQYVTHAPERQLVGHVAAHGSELGRLVPALSSRLPDLPPSKATDTDTERFLLFAAAVGLLVAASHHQPVVLVLDDLQWADDASLMLARHLVAAEPSVRLLVMATYRDNELSQADALVETLAVLPRHNGVSRIELAGLDDGAVLAFLEATAGQTLDETGFGLAHAVYRETDGNPFFVSEILRHLSETGTIYRDAIGRWVADGSLEKISLPDSVHEVIAARVLRLGSDAGRVLSMAAVIGRDFDLDVLAAATKTSEDDLLDILEAAESVALVREPSDRSGRYRFAHALIQHTLYEGMGSNRRARAHRVVAEAMEELCSNRPGARVGELARHWMSASQPVDLTKAISYARQAGDAALMALAPADALRYYAQALDLYPQATEPDPSLALDLAIGLGTAQRQTGDPASRDTLIDAARRAADLGDTDRLVAAALANHRGFSSNSGVTDTDKIAVLELALDRLPADRPDRAEVLAALCAELGYGSTLKRRQNLADEAVAIALASDDDTAIVRVLNNVHQPLEVPPLHDQSLARTAEALDRAQRLGDPVLLFWAAQWRTETAARAGDIGEVDRCLDIAGSLAQRLDQPTLNWVHTITRSMRAQIAGDPDQAEGLGNEALQLGTDSGQPDAFTVFGGDLWVVSLQRGTWNDLVPLLEQLVADAPGVAGLISGGLAVAHAQSDRSDQASRLLEEFAAAGFDLPMDQTWLATMACYAAAITEYGDERYAQTLFDQLVPWAKQLVTVGGAMAYGPVSHYLGGLATVVGRYDEAQNYFTQAATMSELMSDKFFTARTNLAWGKMFAERNTPGDADMARELLTKAHTAAATNGYAKIERRATEALRHLTEQS